MFVVVCHRMEIISKMIIDLLFRLLLWVVSNAEYTFMLFAAFEEHLLDLVHIYELGLVKLQKDNIVRVIWNFN